MSEAAQEVEVEVLTRELCLPRHQDPTGKVWQIKSQRGKSLLRAQVYPFNASTQVPSKFGGDWTSRAKLEAAIREWLGVQWTAAEAAQKPLATKDKLPRVEAQQSNDELIQAAVDAENAALEAARARVANAGAANK